MKQNPSHILKQVLDQVNPNKQELKEIKIQLDNFLAKIKKIINKSKIEAEVFVGGSYAKGTMIKKDHYDIDIFLRFNEKYKDSELSGMASKILEKIAKAETLHGSRDYFRVKIDSSLFFEIVPVKKVKKPEEAANITDLSYSHVKYVHDNVKSQGMLDEIKIAKAFCHANNCYGAESYVQGFSGYALELLIYYYKGFINFLRAVSKEKGKDKIIIDIEKHYKSKTNVLMDINSSKLQSPIILIDPTYKQRNALAALSNETFAKFKKEAISFLRNSSIKAFEIKKTDLEKIKTSALKNEYKFVLLEADTNRQEGDIAGSKLLKFYRHLEEEFSRYFEIKNKGFNYNKKQTARFFFVAKSKGEIIIDGPDAKDKKNVFEFRRKHKSIFTNKGKIYAREKIKHNLKDFIESWKKKNAQKIKEMYIIGFSILK
ncbi:nucleotidyltransferase domain-containing protein [Candidatus Pacearchaeota archaeon]|nr:nucleotidyltransferase domain-containing protein [Candidatus Pacearchaeota archaeon]